MSALVSIMYQAAEIAVARGLVYIPDSALTRKDIVQILVTELLEDFLTGQISLTGVRQPKAYILGCARRKLYRLYRQLETGHLPTVTFGELGTDISIVDETLPPRRVKRPTEERALSRCWMVTPHWFRIRRALLEKER